MLFSFLNGLTRCSEMKSLPRSPHHTITGAHTLLDTPAVNWIADTIEQQKTRRNTAHEALRTSCHSTIQDRY